MLSNLLLDQKIIHVTASLSRFGGGIPPVIWALAKNMQLLGCQNLVSSLKDENSEEDCRNQIVPTIIGRICGPRNFGYSFELGRKIEKHIHSNDILHTHGLWMYPGCLAFKLSRKHKCKRLVSPHGMLEPWALNNSRWKKRTAAWLFENKNLQTADCLHALCDREAESFRRYGLRNPIAIISNGVELEGKEDDHNKQVFFRNHPYLAGRQLLLFLSRVHPKKGLPDLLHAWANVKAQDKNWSLLIVGPDELGHESQLRTLATKLRIDKHIHFQGPAYKKSKSEVLFAADAFVLPSLSEGFSMAVLEAAAAALPILLTRECNFKALAEVGGAVEVSAGLDGITGGLTQLLQLNGIQRNLMGAKGAELVKQAYTWPTIATEMVSVYNWLSNNGPKPNSVQIG